MTTFPTRFPTSRNYRPGSGPWWLFALLVGVTAFLALASVVAHADFPGAWLLVAGCLAGTVLTDAPRPRVTASVETGLDGKPNGFALTLGDERTLLEPGKTWVQTDHHKWVTRGIIEPPQSFGVRPDGSVDLNGEHFDPSSPDAVPTLTEQINKRHLPTSAEKPKPVATRKSPAARSGRVEYRVHLDPLGHLLITATRGAESTETGLRGLTHLAAEGWLRRPGQFHLDPLQRYVEIDGERFECNQAGAEALGALLNSRYVPPVSAASGQAIEVRENAASSTGFDIHFWIHRAGTRFEIKGHLSQDKLDILQDHDRCDLIQPGVILRLSPPFLYLRRRRPDGIEEPLPGLPDVKYRGMPAADLQRILNHPLIRKQGAPATTGEESSDEGLPSDIAEIRVTRHAADHRQLWLDLVRLNGGQLTRALTRHNLDELAGQGLFRPGEAVSMSIDNLELHVQSESSGAHERLRLDATTADDELQRAGHLLTAALRKPTPVARTVNAPESDSEVAIPPPTPPPPLSSPPPRSTQPPSPSIPVAEAARRPSPPPPPPKPSPSSPPSDRGEEDDLDDATRARFADTDPQHVSIGVFEQLAHRVGWPVQDLLLSLPRVFSDRRFQVLPFGDGEVRSVLELRSETFYGFYLTHLGPANIDLVYACRGTHIEWGLTKCVLQPGVGAESVEFRGPALRGLAQDARNDFVFLVTPKYLAWVQPYAKACAEACAHFLTVGEWARRRTEFPLIWPVAPSD